MRLSPYQHQTILHAARHCFGKEVEIWLFGSRVDDDKRGGDIDLLIRLPPHYDGDAVELFKRKIHFLGELETALGEQKIDVVIATPTSRLAIEAIAEKTGIEL